MKKRSALAVTAAGAVLALGLSACGGGSTTNNGSGGGSEAPAAQPVYNAALDAVGCCAPSDSRSHRRRIFHLLKDRAMDVTLHAGQTNNYLDNDD